MGLWIRVHLGGWLGEEEGMWSGGLMRIGRGRGESRLCEHRMGWICNLGLGAWIPEIKSAILWADAKSSEELASPAIRHSFHCDRTVEREARRLTVSS